VIKKILACFFAAISYQSSVISVVVKMTLNWRIFAGLCSG
jgi:hypothetical protein